MKKERTQLNINTSPELLKATRIYAIANDLTIKEVVEMALSALLKDPQKVKA